MAAAPQRRRRSCATSFTSRRFAGRRAAGAARPGRARRAGGAADPRRAGRRRPRRRARRLARLDGLALAVAAVVVMPGRADLPGPADVGASSARTCWPRRASTSSRTVLRLPLGRVESASSGDLVTRVTRDVTTMSESVRFGLPEAVIAAMTTVLTVVAMLLNSCAARRCRCSSARRCCCSPSGATWRARPKGYITEGGTYSRINTTLTETVEGARTVEALGPAGAPDRRRRRRHRRLRPGRALHDGAAQPAVRRPRHRLRHPAGAGAAARRGRLRQRLGHAWARSPPRRSTCRR